jgi:hypothetical protein
MPDFQAADITHVSAPAFVQRVTDRVPQADTIARSTSDAALTTLIRNGTYVFLKAGDPPSGGCDLANTLAASEATAPLAPSMALQPSPAESTSSARVRLLGMKYESSATTEDLARLDILTMRLKSMMPRTTAADIDMVEASANEIAAIVEKVNSLASEYGV